MSRKDKSLTCIILVLCIVAVAVLVGYAVVVSSLYPKMSDSGQFGDMFGAVNALFSGFALAGVVGAIVLQRQDLDLTRKEMKQQTEIFSKQRSQEEFFYLLKIHNEFVNSFCIQAEIQKTGRKVFEHFHEKCRMHRAQSEAARKETSEEDNFIEIYNSYKEILEGYLIRLENIMLFIDESDVGNKKFYVDIVKGCINNDEKEFIELSKKYIIEKFPSLFIFLEKY